ncbi:MAG: hypothetical protein EOM31_04810 [Bacteroidia bacterium]|nr:hypothetical protein [Bacteroidia bacterium]
MKKTLYIWTNLDAEFIMTKKNSTDLPSIDSKEALEKQIKDLEKALAYSQLETRALNILIDIAEEKEGIRIRKESKAKK